MRRIYGLTSGNQRLMDRALDLKDEIAIFIKARYGVSGIDFVVSGCDTTDNGNGTVNITPGIIMIGGNLFRYDGDNNIASDGSKTFIAEPVVKNTYSEQKAIVAAEDPKNHTQLKIGRFCSYF